MTDDELAAIEARAKAATTGPWANWYGWQVVGNDLSVASVNTSPVDAEFIAHARQDIPALLAEVRRLKALLTLNHGGP